MTQGTDSHQARADRSRTLRADAEAAAAGLPALLLSAERLSVALLQGGHGLRRAGSGDDFWQYRPATAGDSARTIDWRRSARSDAQFVRDREAQTAQSAVIWVSCGAGMGYRGADSRPAKRNRAELLSLAIAIAMLRGGEKVALAGGLPRPGRAQADRIAFGLAQSWADPRPEDDAPPESALRPGQRMLLVSDFLGDPQPLLGFLEHAASLGVRGAMLQVLDPDEEVFPFQGAVLFRSPDGGVRHQTRDAAGIRADYLARLAQRRELLSRAARQSGWHFGTHDTASPPAQALMWIASVMEG
ncbi:DUF58 domain-containing protein [uncultured Paracoccus sp.]|uniref:DUF58 domain-containing protein n=1 Tax=uncultured Paracoccus sp. TaxID=189685 RepID=UPI0025DB2FF3|nr:DUF58 domain-containing protein [uncultured Paracoccus sp.]